MANDPAGIPAKKTRVFVSRDRLGESERNRLQRVLDALAITAGQVTIAVVST